VARNVGIQCSEGDALVFIDDDVLPPPTMTYALALRQAHTSQCLFLGFREDVDSDVFFDPGGREPTADSDWRCGVRQGREPGAPESGDDTAESSRPVGPFTFLGETQRFKAFGHGRKVGWSYLPTVVIGHSMCVQRRDAVAAGGFVEGLFEGWGMEDTAFGAALIAHWRFVVPAMDWVSFHLRHEGRRVTRAEQREGNRRNAVTYERWIAEPAGGRRPFPTHRVRPTGREGIFELDD